MKVTKKQSSMLQATVTISDVPAGTPVWDVKAKRIIIKVKVSGFLLNSNIVLDVINRGDCFVFCPALGTLYPTTGNREVMLVIGELIWSEA